jgi:uncharacterized membrane protein
VSAKPDLPTGTPHRRWTAGTQVACSAAAGIVLAIPLALTLRPNLGPMLAWDFSAVIYLLWVWLRIWGMDAETTAEVSQFEDPTRATWELIILVASVVSLVAVAFVLKDASREKGTAQVLLATLGVASVAISWAIVHTVFALTYARLYFSGTDGGVNFKNDDPPCYSDFAYLSFTVGMTFQISDTDLTSNVFRRTVLHQALLSYVFGAGILATTVNLVANL